MAMKKGIEGVDYAIRRRVARGTRTRRFVNAVGSQNMKQRRARRRTRIIRWQRPLLVSSDVARAQT